MKNKDYISFPKKYDDFINLGFGKWTDLKPSVKEETDFYFNMMDYFNEFIIPFVKRKSLSTFRRILKVL